MSELNILQPAALAGRVSAATRRVLEERANPFSGTPGFLSHELYAILQLLVRTLLPQSDVDTAAAIDARLREGKNGGWRFAALPADGEAYREGLQHMAALAQREHGRPMEQLGAAEIEALLERAAAGDADGEFALSKWLLTLKTDAVKLWLAHPAAMQRMEYYGFADGATGMTDGPTATEGWQAITPNRALPFEHAGKDGAE